MLYLKSDPSNVKDTNDYSTGWPGWDNHKVPAVVSMFYGCVLATLTMRSKTWSCTKRTWSS